MIDRDFRRFIEQIQLPKRDSFLEDKFVQVKYSSENNSQIYIVIDRYNVYMFDRRVITFYFKSM